MLTGRDIVLIASIDWEPLWQSHQEIATRLASAGNRVLFIENTGIRAPTVADAPRVVKRVRGWSRSLLREPREVRENVWVYSPVVLPPFGPPGAREVNRAVFVPAIGRVARRLGFVDPIVWTWLPTDTALDIARKLLGPRSLLIFFIIADFDPLTRRPKRLARTEDQLLRECDLVFAYTEASALRASRARVVKLLPPSVNLERFFFAPGKAEVNQHPLLGYVGGVDRRLDLRLIAECAHKRPGWSWELIGPVNTDVSPLQGLANVSLDGAREHQELPELVAGFDIGVVPYRLSPENDTLAPTKINEYLATGKPVVATALPWVKGFQERHGVLELCADTADSFISACERALRSTIDREAGIRRRRVAEKFAWLNRLEELSEIIEEAVREKDARAARVTPGRPRASR